MYLLVLYIWSKIQIKISQQQIIDMCIVQDIIFFLELINKHYMFNVQTQSVLINLLIKWIEGHPWLNICFLELAGDRSKLMGHDNVRQSTITAPHFTDPPHTVANCQVPNSQVVKSQIG